MLDDHVSGETVEVQDAGQARYYAFNWASENFHQHVVEAMRRIFGAVDPGLLATIQKLKADLREAEPLACIRPRLPRNRRRHDIWNAHIEV